MKTIALDSIIDAIDEIKNTQEELSNNGYELKQILEKAQEEAQILKENWQTEAGIDSCNLIIELLDLNPTTIINRIQMCYEGEITYTTQNTERKVNIQGENNVK